MPTPLSSIPGYRAFSLFQFLVCMLVRAYLEATSGVVSSALFALEEATFVALENDHTSLSLDSECVEYMQAMAILFEGIFSLHERLVAARFHGVA